MSEYPVSPVSTKKSLARLFAVGLPVLALLLIYGAGIILMPVTVLKNYQARDCAGVLSLHKIYANVYPAFVEDTSLSLYVKECGSYMAATSAAEKGTARQAYDAYQAYVSAYPNGLYAKEAREQSGRALLNIANDQVEQKQYDQALVTLNQIVSEYAELPTATEALTLIPSVYTASGTELREAGNFEQAERVFNDFQRWAQSNQKPDHISHVQTEMVQTYLKWGLSYLDQKRFEDALAKLELAVAIDPQSQFDSAAQVKDTQGQVYINWGNDLLEQGNFEMAIQKFDRAVSVAGTDDPEATDALTNGHIRWASDLQTKDDFRAALKELGIAQEKAVSDGMKQLVESAFQETYLAFANSSAPQARNAMKDAPKQVCEKHKQPDLPIFGLNKDSIRFAIYGVEDKLSENVVAKTPGEMHYIACVETANQTVETRWIRQIILQTSRGYYYVRVQQFRVETIWNVNLIQSDTGQIVAQTTLQGGTPPPFPVGEDDSGNYFYGPPPMDELVQWMQSVTN